MTPLVRISKLAAEVPGGLTVTSSYGLPGGANLGSTLAQIADAGIADATALSKRTVQELQDATTKLEAAEARLASFESPEEAAVTLARVRAEAGV